MKIFSPASVGLLFFYNLALANLLYTPILVVPFPFFVCFEHCSDLAVYLRVWLCNRVDFLGVQTVLIL